VKSDLSEPLYYYDLYNPLWEKRHCNCSINNILEAATKLEEKKFSQEDATDVGAREKDYAASKARGQGNNPLADEALPGQ
jgi:hypothetical protein